MFFSGILNRLFKKSRIINGYRVRLIEKSLKSRSNLHKGKVVKDAIEVVALKWRKIEKIKNNCDASIASPMKFESVLIYGRNILIKVP